MLKHITHTHTLTQMQTNMQNGLNLKCFKFFENNISNATYPIGGFGSAIIYIYIWIYRCLYCTQTIDVSVEAFRLLFFCFFSDEEINNKPSLACLYFPPILSRDCLRIFPHIFAFVFLSFIYFLYYPT